MTRVNEYLKSLGLSEAETKIYTGLLEHGPSTVLELANHLNMKRITVHFNTQNLISKGLIAQTKHGARRKLVAERPEKLLGLLEERERRISDMKKEFPDVLKEMQQIIPYTQTSESVDVRYYEGKIGIESIYKDAMSAKELRSYVDISIMNEYMPYNSKLFYEGLKTNRDLIVYELIAHVPQRRDAIAIDVSQNERFRYKFLPGEVKFSATDTLIYDGTVAIVNVRERMIGVVLQNIDYYHNSKELFDLLWRMLPDILD